MKRSYPSGSEKRKKKKRMKKKEGKTVVSGADNDISITLTVNDCCY